MDFPDIFFNAKSFALGWNCKGNCSHEKPEGSIPRLLFWESSFIIRRLIKRLAQIALPVLIDSKYVKFASWWPLCNPEIAIKADMAERDVINSVKFHKQNDKASKMHSMIFFSTSSFCYTSFLFCSLFFLFFITKA